MRYDPLTTRLAASRHTEAEVVSDAIGRLLDASLLKRTPEAIRLAADVCGVSVREVRDSYRSIVDATTTMRQRGVQVGPSRLIDSTYIDITATESPKPKIVDREPLILDELDRNINLLQIRVLLHVYNHPNSKVCKTTGAQGVSSRTARYLERLGYLTIEDEDTTPVATLTTKGEALIKSIVMPAGTTDIASTPESQPPDASLPLDANTWSTSNALFPAPSLQ